jgi:hypothetical protein
VAINNEVTWLYFWYLLNLLHCCILKYKWKWELGSLHKLIKTGTIWGVIIILGLNSIDVFLRIFALLGCYSEFVSSLLITNYQPTLRKFTEKWKPQIHRRGKPEISIYFTPVWAKDFNLVLVTRGPAVAYWLRHYATNRQVASSIPDGVIGIFQWHNPCGRTMALGSTQPLTEMSTRCISWG